MYMVAGFFLSAVAEHEGDYVRAIDRVIERLEREIAEDEATITPEDEATITPEELARGRSWHEELDAGWPGSLWTRRSRSWESKPRCSKPRRREGVVVSGTMLRF
jgi:hypothetical protein